MKRKAKRPNPEFVNGQWGFPNWPVKEKIEALAKRSRGGE